METTALEAYEALLANGLSALILKGLALEALLYEAHEPRLYGDIDIMVNASTWRRALGVLGDLGWHAPQAGQRVAENALHSWTLERTEHGRTMQLDLHHRLHAARISSRRVWRIASADPQVVVVDGRELLTTSVGVTLFHLAVAVSPEVGGSQRHITEFHRMCALKPNALAEGREVARRLRATYAFERGVALAHGQTTHPEQRAITDTRAKFWWAFLAYAPDNRARYDFLREAVRPPLEYRQRTVGRSRWHRTP